MSWFCSKPSKSGSQLGVGKEPSLGSFPRSTTSRLNDSLSKVFFLKTFLSFIFTSVKWVSDSPHITTYSWWKSQR